MKNFAQKKPGTIKKSSNFDYYGLTPSSPPPGKALVVQNWVEKVTNLLSSWRDPGLKITKEIVVSRTMVEKSEKT